MVMEIPEEQSDVAEVAKEILEKLLELLGVQAEVSLAIEAPVEAEEGATASVSLNISGDDLGILIGRRGQTLASLQYLIRLITAHQTQVRLPIIIDVEGYKRRRYEALRALALRMAEQVSLKKTPFTLEPMPAFERRVVHLALANHPDVTTESTGFGEARKVVILPKTGQPD